MICLFKFCFHRVTQSLQRTKNSKKKDDMLSFPSAGAQHESEGLAGGGLFQKHMVGLCRKTQEETQTRPGRRQDPHLLSNVPPARVLGREFIIQERSFGSRNHTRHPFLWPILKSKDDFQLFIYQPKKNYLEKRLFIIRPPIMWLKTTSINSAVTASDPLNCPIRCLPILQVRREVHHLPRSVMPGALGLGSEASWAGLAQHTCQTSFPSSICTKGHIHAQVDVPLYNPLPGGCYWLSASAVFAKILSKP